MFSATEDKRPSIITKDVHIALIAQEIPETVNQEPLIKTKVYIYYKSQYHRWYAANLSTGSTVVRPND